jgi:hypothetical protein
MIFFNHNGLFTNLLKLFLRLSKNNLRTSLIIWKASIQSLYSVIKYSKLGYPIINTSKLSSKRNSDTLFILGSGPSINELSSDDWIQINSSDSWGFNFWFCHDHVPNCYFLQSPISQISEKKYLFNLDIMMAKMLMDKKGKYENVNFFVRGDGVNNFKFHQTEIGKSLLENNFTYNFIPELVINSSSKISPEILINELNKSNYFETSKNINLIPKFGSTIGELIPLALICGYKKIILCGIDMNDGSHFYDSNLYFKKYKFLEVLSKKNRDREIHEHMDNSHREYTLKNIIIELNKFAKNAFDSQIYVSSETSSLYSEIPKYILKPNKIK